ncbi:YybH family protein [Streptomyces sp. NPDC051018]|uniref:YybH family protein n=1 Tax=Streptomyces sp. NPDC051018 TaxID=3365639 RepID=UPI0037A57BBA
MARELSDEERILQLHSDWYYANYNINIPLMRTVFPTGDENFLMFNLNDHPYFGVDDLAKLWTFYARTDRWGLCEDHVIRVDVCGDMAYVVSEGNFPAWRIRDEDGNPLAEEVDRPAYYRSTEIYRRDDGEGRPEWRMWHFHCSTRPDDDEAPPAKTDKDSATARGLGNTPYSTGTRSEYRQPAER